MLKPNNQSEPNNEATDLQSLTTNLFDQTTYTDNVEKFDGAEAMLVSQATELNAIFFELLAIGRRQKNIPDMVSTLTLAFSVQDNCRLSLESIAAVKAMANEDSGLTEQTGHARPQRPTLLAPKKLLAANHN